MEPPPSRQYRGTMTYADGSQRSGMWQRGQPVDGHGQVISTYLARQEAEAQTVDVHR
ncbi:MAG: hypothetical protein H6559_28060 [Lewinellaceae bacterium]|nr:hypothetical protein [Lewinellaceae bacterium]